MRRHTCFFGAAGATAPGRHRRAGSILRLEEILSRAGRELAYPEVVKDEQRHARHLAEVVLTLAVEGGVGELFRELCSEARTLKSRYTREAT